jgi:hypothetical protein
MRRGPRPSLVQAGIAFVTANACALSYSLGYFEQAWIWMGALFLVMEVGAAVSAEPGDTLSECTWLWFGIRPRAGRRLVRIPALAQFGAVLWAHFLTGGGTWYAGGGAVIVSSVPVVAVIAHSVIERRGAWARSGRR